MLLEDVIYFCVSLMWIVRKFGGWGFDLVVMGVGLKIGVLRSYCYVLVWV